MNNLIAVMLLSVVSITAQEPTHAPPKFYKLDYVIKELDGGKVINSRSYSAVLASYFQRPIASIRTGSKVPYALSPTDVNFYDVGVNIDSQAGDKQDEKFLWVHVKADVSSAVMESVASRTFPTIRNNRWEGDSLVPIGKPTVLFSSDDPSSKRVMQLELTATLVR